MDKVMALQRQAMKGRESEQVEKIVYVLVRASFYNLSMQCRNFIIQRIGL